jgi:hypothetical protein
MTIQITEEYCYTLLSGVFVYNVNLFLGHFFVGPARKRLGIKLPNLYESTNEKGELKTNFNNYQRGHMNMVENLAVFYFLLLSAGVFSPFNAAVAGGFWGYS